MGTQEDANKAEPQNEFLSGFKIKDRMVSQGEEEQRSFVTKAGKVDGDFTSKKSSPESQNRTETNPYRLTQQMSDNTPLEQISNDSFEKKAGTGFVQKLKDKLFQGKSDSIDTRQKVMVVMIPILFIIMIFIFRQVLSKPPKKTKGANSNDKSALAVNKSSDNDIEWTIPEPLPVKMRDPIKFRQRTPSSTAQENQSYNIENGIIYVQSIVYSDDKPSVVINNQIVHLNQEIFGAVVVEINKDHIVFEREGKRWTQKVAEEVPKENVAEEVPKEDMDENIN